jgi:hypothetical protein
MLDVVTKCSTLLLTIHMSKIQIKLSITYIADCSMFLLNAIHITDDVVVTDNMYILSW